MGQRKKNLSAIQNIEILPDTGRRLKDLTGVKVLLPEIKRLCNALADPTHIETLGAIPPDRILVSGKYGVGKDAIVEAIAGETGIPIIKTSGSHLITHEIDEAREYFGSLVREARDQIKEQKKTGNKNARCIIYIDRVDAIPDDSLDHVLTSLKTISQNDDGNIIVIASPFEPEDLTKEMLEHFPIHLQVPVPDFEGRLEILNKIMPPPTKRGANICLREIAERTFGYTPYDIQNIITRAAIYAQERGNKTGRKVRKLLGQDFSNAIHHHEMDGPKTKSKRSVFVKESTAIHEAGHAIISLLLEKTGIAPFESVTIVPQGNAEGLTLLTDREDQHDRTLWGYKAYLTMTMGGRVAEELIYGDNYTFDGASGDIEDATKTAHDMVARFGFSHKIGMVNLYDSAIAKDNKDTVFKEVQSLIHKSYEEATKLLEENQQALIDLAKAMTKKETLTRAEVIEITGINPEKPAFKHLKDIKPA